MRRVFDTRRAGNQGVCDVGATRSVAGWLWGGWVPEWRNIPLPCRPRPRTGPGTHKVALCPRPLVSQHSSGPPRPCWRPPVSCSKCPHVLPQPSLHLQQIIFIYNTNIYTYTLITWKLYRNINYRSFDYVSYLNLCHTALQMTVLSICILVRMNYISVPRHLMNGQEQITVIDSCKPIHLISIISINIY